METVNNGNQPLQPYNHVLNDFSSRRIIAIVLNPGWVKTDMGGSGATRTPEDSVAAMRKVIDGLGPQDTGKFFNHSGDEFPW